MTTAQFEKLLHQALDESDLSFEGTVRRVETFEEAGILTQDRGLVVAFDDGAEIQVTLVLSRRGRDDDSEDDDDDGTFAHAARVNGIR